MTVGAKGIKHGQADTILLVGLKIWKRESNFLPMNSLMLETDSIFRLLHCWNICALYVSFCVYIG